MVTYHGSSFFLFTEMTFEYIVHLLLTKGLPASLPKFQPLATTHKQSSR
jgi:hypothetical protein